MLYNKKHIYLRSPLRISFVGGGTDLESYYSQGETGFIVSGTIDNFVYVTLKDMFDANVRVHHSEIETQSITSRITHHYTRTALEHFGMFRGAEVVLTSDVMTTGSGLGASSAMMSALILGCSEIRNQDIGSPYDLAELTFALEKTAGTVGGKQDQYAAAFGGLNAMSFSTDAVKINPINIASERLKAFQDRLFLVFTNIARSSKLIQQNLEEGIMDKSKKSYLDDLRNLTREFYHKLLDNNTELNELGQILHEGWVLKRKVNNHSTNPYIEQLYDSLRNKGVLGGKILGAGGGGFFLAFAENPKIKEVIKYDLYPNFIAMDVNFTNTGTEVLWKNF